MGTYDDLLERAKWGIVTSDEMEIVSQELLKAPGELQYTLVHILGRGVEQILDRGGKVPLSYYQRQIERFLKGPDDLLARLALWVLCRWWRLYDQYIDELKRYMRGLPWDSREEVRRAAISLVGEYLHDSAKPDLLRELIRIFEDTSNGQSSRQSAYYALAEALGRNWRQQLPPSYEDISLDPPPDPTILREARERLSKEEAN